MFSCRQKWKKNKIMTSNTECYLQQLSVDFTKTDPIHFQSHAFLAYCYMKYLTLLILLLHQRPSALKGTGFKYQKEGRDCQIYVGNNFTHRVGESKKKRMSHISAVSALLANR